MPPREREMDSHSEGAAEVMAGQIRETNGKYQVMLSDGFEQSTIFRTAATLMRFIVRQRGAL